MAQAPHRSPKASTDPAPTTPSGSAIDRRMAMTVMGSLGVAALGASALAQPGGSGHPRDSAAKKFGIGPLGVNELGWDERNQLFVLPTLPYAPAALEPFIDAQTMQIHHSKHHAGYVAGLNNALKQLTWIRTGEGDPALIKHWSRELAFHGGGHINHAIFWRIMAPPGQGGGGQPAGVLSRAIQRDFGSFDQFKAHFIAAANAVEGSGWAWLVLDRLSGRLMIQQMEKQQNMLLTACVPLLGIDVWEHAYYLKYQNRRGEYVGNWFNLINWSQVSSIFEGAIG